MVATTTLTAAEVAKIRAELWVGSSKIADLTVPASIKGAVANTPVTFTAPANLRLRTRTEYGLLVYAIGGQSKLAFTDTLSTSDDDGAASGWTVKSTSSVYTSDGPPFTSGSQLTPIRIRVNGSAAPPLEPTGLTAAPGGGSGQLDLSWTAPAGTLTGYDVHYTSSATVANHAAPGSNAATGWVAVSRTETSPPTASQSITGLTNGAAYRVRVRAVDSIGASAWAFGAGTPRGGPAAVTSLTATSGRRATGPVRGPRRRARSPATTCTTPLRPRPTTMRRPARTRPRAGWTRATPARRPRTRLRA